MTETGAESGEEFRRRRVALGLGHSELAKLAGVDRSRVKMLEEGDTNLRDTTVAAIDRALAELEHETGMDLPSQVDGPQAPGVVRVEVQGVYGAKALILEAPPENLAELKAMVDQIMRSLRDEQQQDEAGK